MRPTIQIAGIISTVIFIAYACGVVKQDEKKKDIQSFITRFQDSLHLPATKLYDDFFHSNQSWEAILDALTVLKNQDSSGIRCYAAFSETAFIHYETRTQVTIPVKFDTTGLKDEHVNPSTAIVFWVEKTADDFIISELDGSKFYQTYTSVKNAKFWAAERKIELEKRLPIFSVADSLEMAFDSVIWYAQHNDELFFYVVNGTWRNYFVEKSEPYEGAFSMGLISAAGDTIVPIEYDLVGTLDFPVPGIVEVKRNGKYGYFSLDSSKLVIDTAYDIILPFADAESNCVALVLDDSTYGWIDNTYAYFEGYPSEEAFDYLEGYEYLRNSIVLKAGNQVFCEIPKREYIGYGIVIPPSYYVKNKVFDQIVGGINTTRVPMNGWTDYIESSKSMVARIGDEINALISVMEERYIGGREEFYGKSQVTFVNRNEEEIGSTEMPTDQEVIFTHLGNGILELKATGTGWYFYTPGRERDIPVYKYFQIESESQLQELTSNRLFPMTEFARIDSSYIMGEFAVYDHTEGETYEEDGPGDPGFDVYNYYEILSVATLSLIRDEILAVYGFRTDNSENAEILQRQGYSMTLLYTRDEALRNASENDKANLAFLDKVISLMQEQELNSSSESAAL